MEASDQVTHIDTRQRKQRDRISTAELFTVIEGLLPFAQVEIDCLEDYVSGFPNDPDHTQDAERVRQGKEAIESANRLIVKKSPETRRKQRALGKKQGLQQETGNAPTSEKSAAVDE
jgi:hypothetical protein